LTAAYRVAVCYSGTDLLPTAYSVAVWYSGTDLLPAAYSVAVWYSGTDLLRAANIVEVWYSGTDIQELTLWQFGTEGLLYSSLQCGSLVLRDCFTAA